MFTSVEPELSKNLNLRKRSDLCCKSLWIKASAKWLLTYLGILAHFRCSLWTQHTSSTGSDVSPDLCEWVTETQLLLFLTLWCSFRILKRMYYILIWEFFYLIFSIFRGFCVAKLYLHCIYNPFIHFLSTDMNIWFPA